MFMCQFMSILYSVMYCRKTIMLQLTDSFCSKIDRSIVLHMLLLLSNTRFIAIKIERNLQLINTHSAGYDDGWNTPYHIETNHHQGSQFLVSLSMPANMVHLKRSGLGKNAGLERMYNP